MQLIESAASWMVAALDAWAADDFGKVAALAPLAVEHLGKAVLWRKNPVLLVPLERTAEKSLVRLAIKADISDMGLKTVSLNTLLDRLELVLGTLPVDKDRRTRLVHTRNGAMHVGSLIQSRYVLLDSLILCQAFLRSLKEGESEFYANHFSSVENLLREERSELEHQILVKRARAEQRLRQLRDVGSNFSDVISMLEKDARASLSSRDFGAQLEGADYKCPECSATGLLFGLVEVLSEHEWDVEETPKGLMSYIVETHWEVFHSPQAFACNVCRLTLNGPKELEALGVRSHGDKIDLTDLGEDFDPGMHEFKSLLDREVKDFNE